MTSKSASTRTETAVVAVVTLKGLARTPSGPEAFGDLVARLASLVRVHAEAHGGHAQPTGVDPVAAVFTDLASCFAAMWALCNEVESAREGHRHGGLLGIGIAVGEVIAQDTYVMGPPVTRALRLAIVAEERGEVLVEHAALVAGVPEGFGVHSAKGDRLGFPYDHVADYR